MTLKERIASWAIRSLGDRMSAEQLVTAVFGPTASTGARWGGDALLQAYNSMPWLRAVVGRISWSTSCVPWQLFVATSGENDRAIRRRDLAYSNDPQYRIRAYKSLRREDSLREITDHPVLDLLDHGNPRFPGQVARQITQQHLDLIGEGAWVLERNGLMLPSDFYPIPPTWIAQTPWDVEGNDEWIIHSNRGTLRVPKEDVIYFYHPNPRDPYDRGTGIGASLGDELETDEATAKHLKRWFKNFAIPPYIISKKGGSGSAGKSPTERLEEQWMQKLSGRNNVPFFSTSELSVQELSHTFKDQELSQLRKDERDILIHVYGMPPEIFGIIENSNRSTIDAADYLMGKYVSIPRLEFQRVILQKQLVERYDSRLILDYVSPVLEDREFELKVIQAAPFSFSVDEIRELASRRKLPKDQGEGFFIPMNVTYVRDYEEAGISDPEPENEALPPPPEPEDEDDADLEE